MVDNVAITPGTGATIAADDLGSGVLAQRVKPVWGPDGTGNDIDVASGKPLPVQVRSATGLIPIGEPTDAAATATDTTSVSGISLWKQISKTLQAAAVSVTTAFFAKITDGTSTVAVKAANTAPVATDPALVVAISPNSVNENGQTTASASAPVVIASDQSAVAVKAASGAIASGAIADLAHGQAAMAASVPVVLASNQSSIPVAATLAAETTKVIGTVNVSSGQKITNVDGYGEYETVAASQTAQALGATGATGDYLAGVLVFPGTAGCGVVTILDNATTIGTFAGGGTTALPSLVPFLIPVGLFSKSGAWKITTGANVTAVGIGDFT